MPDAYILGIESSCDDTGAAVVRSGRQILSNVVASQIAVHQPYGGVVPELASREHLRTIVPVVRKALADAGQSYESIDALAVTQGPGLAGSLLVGISYTKALAFALDKPLIAVNHLEGHIHAVLLEERQKGNRDLRFPVLALVVSGGHTHLYLAEQRGESWSYQNIGHTRDDAAGEAFDKVAKVLGLGYPGGPAIQQAAQWAEEELQQQKKPIALARSAYRLPRAWLRGTYDFSFSGLKTAMLHLAEGATAQQQGSGGKQVSQYTRMGVQAAQKGMTNVALLASSFQEAIVDVLAVKTCMAAQEYNVKQVVLAGGVAANLSLRTRLEQELLPLRIYLSYPPIEFCTDNAAMIGSAAFFHLCQGETSRLDLDVEPGLSLPFQIQKK